MREELPVPMQAGSACVAGRGHGVRHFRHLETFVRLRVPIARPAARTYGSLNERSANERVVLEAGGEFLNDHLRPSLREQSLL